LPGSILKQKSRVIEAFVHISAGLPAGRSTLGLWTSSLRLGLGPSGPHGSLPGSILKQKSRVIEAFVHISTGLPAGRSTLGLWTSSPPRARAIRAPRVVARINFNKRP
jgi:hypothetical protein